MIEIKIFGLDPYVVGRISRLETDAIIRELNLDNEEVIFICPDEYIFHRGVEQTSWQVIAYVTSDFEMTKEQEEKIADILLTAFEPVCMNSHIQFIYPTFGHLYGANNTNYPRFITHDDLEDEEDAEEREECTHDDDCECEHEIIQEIFLKVTT